MKKKSIKALKLNKNKISKLQSSKIVGGSPSVPLSICHCATIGQGTHGCPKEEDDSFQ